MLEPILTAEEREDAAEDAAEKIEIRHYHRASQSTHRTIKSSIDIPLPTELKRLNLATRVARPVNSLLTFASV